MIRYALLCDGGHEFDSWFPGSDAYDEQARRGLVECPVCRSTDVKKSIMAPRLGRGGPETSPDSGAADMSTAGASPPVVMDERLATLRAALREMRTAIAKNTTDVGAAFPDEARKMHMGDIDHRPIRGEATPDEVRELIEDGIAILPVPMIPEDWN